MQAGTARLLACTLTDAVSIINSEVWSSSCPENQYHDIEVALNIIHRRLLGVEAKTASVAVWHELGVASVATRIDAAALKFRNNILSLDPRDFLVRRVYDGLMNDSKGRGSSRNGALFLENLASEANWPGPLKKPAAKKFVNEHLWPYSGTHGFEKNDTPSIISSSPETCKSVEPILNSFPTLFPL